MNSKKSSPNISIHINNTLNDLDADPAALENLAKSVCSQFNLNKAIIDIEIVDDEQIRTLNNQFLNKDETTDCLSFDLSDNQQKTFELMINGQLAVKKAKNLGHSAEAELALYIVHGLLHNLGFDDSDSQKAKKMHQTEDNILQQAGYGCVFKSGTA